MYLKYTKETYESLDTNTLIQRFENLKFLHDDASRWVDEYKHMLEDTEYLEQEITKIKVKREDITKEMELIVERLRKLC